MATGRTEQALNLTSAAANDPSVTPWPLLTHALFLYVARRFDEARKVILQAKTEYPDTWLSHVLWSCVQIALGKGKSNPPLLGMSLPQHLSDGTEVYTALCFLDAAHRLEPGHPDYALLKQTATTWINWQLAEWEPADERDFWSPPKRRVSPFHLGLAFLAIGEFRTAIEWLGRDAERGHPLMAWLHLWPLLDPLRNLPEFESLISGKHLPDL